MHFPNANAAELVAAKTIQSAEAIQAMSESFVMGLLLMGITYWMDSSQINVPDSDGKVSRPRYVLQNASNVLFMSVAICTVIMLVGNNVARAFALGAAIAMVRFKMKLGENSSGSGLLFAILCGMACGIDASYIGWILTAGFAIVQVGLSSAIDHLEKKTPQYTLPTETLSTGTAATPVAAEDEKTLGIVDAKWNPRN